MRRDLYFSPNMSQVGLGVTLLSVSAFFIALILAFSYRIEAEQSWRQFKMPTLLWMSTAFLACSSGILEGGRYSLRRAFVSRYRGRLLAAIALGVFFVALQVSAGIHLLNQGVAAAANPHGSAFYLFMGIHGAHLFIGIAWLAFLYVRSAELMRASENALRKHRQVASIAATYWHFMAVIWVVLFYFLLRWTR